jgi:hypothetical protein
MTTQEQREKVCNRDMENNVNDMETAIKMGTYLGAQRLTDSILELASSGEFLKAAKKAEVLAEFLRHTHRELDVM